MTGRLPPSLNWLIDKRARLDGEIKKMQDAVNCARQLIQELSTIEEDLRAVDRTLKLHIIQVETENISPIRSHYNRVKLPYGELTRLLLSRLRKSNGIPISTYELTLFIAECFTAAGAEEKDFKKLRMSVRTRLKNLVRDGVVQRHHFLTGADEGFWSLACTTTVFQEAHHTLEVISDLDCIPAKL